MPVEVTAEVMAEIAVMVDTGTPMLSEDMPEPVTVTLRLDTRDFALAAHVVTRLREARAAVRGSQVEHAVIGTAAATGEAVTGEAVTGEGAIGEVVIGIRHMDIPGSAILVGAMAIHITGLGITVTAPEGVMIRTTDISRVDTIPTAMDMGLV